MITCAKLSVRLSNKMHCLFISAAISHTSITMSVTMTNNFVIAKYVCEKLF